MKVIGFAGFSGAGKTSLVAPLVSLMCAQGLRVSVVKHAHHDFDVDHEGKDSWRHRKAGAYEVVVASDRRLALMREFAQPTSLSVHDMLAELDPQVDWALVEGFRYGDLPKIEIWRGVSARQDRQPHYPQDPHVWAVATDDPACLPVPAVQPVLDLNHPAAVLQWLLDQGERLAYTPPAVGQTDKNQGETHENPTQTPG